MKLKAFTLLELVVVLAISGTLLAIAIPSYQQYVQRSHRAEAIRAMLASADCQARQKAWSGYFDTSRCLLDQGELRYELSFQPASDTATDHFTITASPVGEISDRCGSLSLDHTGARRISDPSGSVSMCWGGR